MSFLELFDETLDINSTENYELALELNNDSLTFCLLDGIRNKFILLRKFTSDSNNGYSSDQIEEIISRDDFLSKKYKNIKLITPAPRFTLIPAPLYDPARKDEYFSFNHLVNEDDIVLNNKIAEPDSYLLFSVRNNIHELIRKFFPATLPLHHMKALLQHASVACRNTEGFYVHVHIENEYFNIVIFQNKSLHFSNSFYYRNITDILYYTMNVYRNLEIKQDVTIFLSGLTEIYDDLYTNLSVYIKEIRFAEPSGNYTFSYVFNDLDLHKYLNLITAVNCE